ncbi:MAG: NYN domain-containing protein [Verrucomicrobiae bacterium]|nr:NYN domain-containing protein [Verrucomicrobiae bacterium]
MAGNYAYIDGANLHKGIQELGWRLDYRRFRIFLKDRYAVETAYLFLGFISQNTTMYRNLQDAGFVIVFKPTISNAAGEVKGNCDAELVLQATSDFYEKKFRQAVIVTGDGDFACLVSFLKAKQGLQVVLSPNHKKCSRLLTRAKVRLTFLEEFREILKNE